MTRGDSQQLVIDFNDPNQDSMILITWSIHHCTISKVSSSNPGWTNLVNDRRHRWGNTSVCKPQIIAPVRGSNAKCFRMVNLRHWEIDSDLLQIFMIFCHQNHQFCEFLATFLIKMAKIVIFLGWKMSKFIPSL